MIRFPLLIGMIVSFSLMYIDNVNAQAFGEYGRAVGNVPRGGPSFGGGSRSGGGAGGASGGVGDIGGISMPSRLIVAADLAGLYPRQDSESQKIAELSKGEILIPMVQSAGGNDWYMVQTEKGTIGWVKSSVVRPDETKK